MAFLSIAGVSYDVQVTDAGERSPRFVGALVTTFNGGLRSSRRARKRTWGFTLAPMDVATSETLVTAVAVAPVAVTGDAINGAAITAIVEVTAMPFLANLDATHSHLRVPQITVSEV
jgi:hypothetical protein